MTLKIATWNVNSIRIRFDGLNELIKLENPDVICLQEVKAKESDFPFNEIKNLGFKYIALYGIPSYNGVAILSKLPLTNIEQLNWCNKLDGRHIKANVKDIEINNIYIPAGGDIPNAEENPSFAHKLSFIDELTKYFLSKKDYYKDKKMILCGDFNIAPFENDVWNHKQMLKIVSHTPIEVEKLNNLQVSLGFINATRKIHPEPQKVYSWWSYRNANWQTNNKGRLLDHIWTTQALSNQIINVKILKEIRAGARPSDHIPLVLVL